ncbi:hypothetical protein D3C87_1695620 [compost metagenome]
MNGFHDSLHDLLQRHNRRAAQFISLAIGSRFIDRIHHGRGHIFYPDRLKLGLWHGQSENGNPLNQLGKQVDKPVTRTKNDRRTENRHMQFLAEFHHSLATGCFAAQIFTRGIGRRLQGAHVQQAGNTQLFT